MKVKSPSFASDFFPLNENDQYIYAHREGSVEGIVTITVKNVKQVAEGRQFNFLWQGEYNDRIQTNILSSKGILFCMNKHLVGEVPLKVIREFSPPLLMIPSELGKNISSSAIQSIYDYEGNLIDKERIEANISFVGFEDIAVEAGKFKCIHFFVRHNYRDAAENSKKMHIYNFWLAPGLGFVKFMHTFIPLQNLRYIRAGEKTIMNRYCGPFTEVFKLKKAVIAGKTWESDAE
ncbi:hypothetical protein KJA13_02785 [Patescibacteria group bacterium]|nr:hypothetical protein [Patescibacteria group bacterium]